MIFHRCAVKISIKLATGDEFIWYSNSFYFFPQHPNVISHLHDQKPITFCSTNAMQVILAEKMKPNYANSLRNDLDCALLVSGQINTDRLCTGLVFSFVPQLTRLRWIRPVYYGMDPSACHSRGLWCQLK
uniref:Uncharacterized protein n=1 Tax=Anguilla anguilla TaxID=7936 RepID=A0A0E9RQ33_ANGAN